MITLYFLYIGNAYPFLRYSVSYIVGFHFHHFCTVAVSLYLSGSTMTEHRLPVGGPGMLHEYITVV